MTTCGPECKLGNLEVSDIDPGIRTRKEYHDIAGLASDIKRRGLIHPIAVMETETGYKLLAGGRRLLAHAHAKIETIDCKIFPPTLSELEIKSIELMENTMREDLSFYEEAQLSREILRLQQQIHGVKYSTSPDAPGASIRTVAEMMGISHEKLRQDITLADTIDKFPDIGWEKLKNRQEALKIQNNIGRLVVTQQAVERFEKETKRGNTDEYMKRLANSFVVGDFFQCVKEIPSNSIDLVEIDPPYAINLGKIKKGSGKYSYGEDGYNEIDAKSYDFFMLDTFRECYRIMAQDSWLICWFGPEPWFSLILVWLRDSNFTVRGMPCVWVKGDEGGETTSGQTNTPMRHLASAYEMFFYAKKGDPKINRQGMTNVFGYKPVPAAHKIHPTERPLDMMKDILTTFVPEGSRVVVPFAGSGNTILASYKSKMTCIGFDLGKTHKDSYVARLTMSI
ncbi:MAG: ParB N-terminal domain-containing protein [Gammaproteobacteria bacterium]|nr:ParB N-terminal domain-containing protein [Gammaproteobacteria bacterium]